jgi:hypothetical protein
LLLDEVHAQQLALAGRRAVFEHFGADRMAREFASVCRAVLEKALRPEQVNG